MTLPDRHTAAAASIAVRETLGRSTDEEACVALAARIAALISGELDQLQRRQAGMACAKGCNFCCHLRVLVYPHEAIALLHQLKSQLAPELQEGVQLRLFAHAAQLQALDPNEPRPPVPCAFLVDGLCAAYEIRPISCATFHSMSRAPCQRRYETSSLIAVGIPVSTELYQLTGALHEEVGRAVKRVGVSAARVELQTALAALLRNPDLIPQWRAGGEWKIDARGLVSPEVASGT